MRYFEIYGVSLLLFIVLVKSSWLIGLKNVLRLPNSLKRTVNQVEQKFDTSDMKSSFETLHLEKEELTQKINTTNELNKFLRKELAKFKRFHQQEILGMQQLYDKDMAQLFEQIEQDQNDSRKSVTLEAEERCKEQFDIQLGEISHKHDQEVSSLKTELEKAQSSIHQLTSQLAEARQELSNIITIHGRSVDDSLVTINNLKQEIESLQMQVQSLIAHDSETSLTASDQQHQHIPPRRPRSGRNSINDNNLHDNNNNFISNKISSNTGRMRSQKRTIRAPKDAHNGKDIIENDSDRLGNDEI